MKQKLSFGNKITFIMVLAGLIPLILGLLMTYYKGTAELRKVIGADFEGMAKQAAQRVDMLMQMELSAIDSIIISSQIDEYLKDKNNAYKFIKRDKIEELIKEKNQLWNENSDYKFNILINDVSALFRDMVSQGVNKNKHYKFFLTDVEGTVVAANDGNIAFVHKDTEWWKDAYADGVGKRIISDFTFDTNINEFVFYIVTPIYNYRNEILGMLWRGYLKDFLGHAINEIKIAESGHAMLLNGKGTVLICPNLDTNSHSVDIKLANSLLKNESGWMVVKKDIHNDINSIVGYAPVVNINRVLNSNNPNSNTQNSWYTVFRQSPKEFNQPITSLFFYNLIVGIVIVSIMSLIGFLISKKMVQPLQQLRLGARRIGHGDFDYKLLIETGDEFEDLSVELNQMADKLNNSYAKMLEQVVQAKTRELTTLNRIANTVNRTRDLQAILDSALDEVIESMDFDAGAIRVYDDKVKTLTLQSCFGISADMMKLNELVKVGENLDGKVAKYKKSITVNREGKRGGKILENKSLYDDSFTIVTSVPLLSRNELVGTLSVASNSSETINDQDIDLLQGMADMIGTAIGNARAYQESEKVAALEEREWMTRELHDGVAQDLAYLKMQLILLSKNIFKHDKEKIEGDVEKLSSMVVHAYNSVRDLLGAFRPGVDNQEEFSTTLKEFILRVEEESKLKIISNVSLDVAQFPSLTFVHIFRIIQECIANARKHSGALEIYLNMTMEDDNILLTVKDNGSGFDLGDEKASMGTSLGLTIMEERAEKIGGKLKVDSAIGKGTTVSVIIPYNE